MTTAIAIEDVRREVKILKALAGHKNLVRFYDAFEDDHNVYIVMEYEPFFSFNNLIMLFIETSSHCSTLYEYISILADKPVLKFSDLADLTGCVKVENYWIRFCRGRMNCFIFLYCTCNLHYQILRVKDLFLITTLWQGWKIHRRGR